MRETPHIKEIPLKEIPQEQRNLIAAIRAIDVVSRERRNELEPCSLRFDKNIQARNTMKIRKLFFDFIRAVKDRLPEYIMISEEQRGVDIFAASKRSATLGTKTIRKKMYFLPHTEEIYEVDPSLVGEKNFDQYNLGSANFKGFDAIRGEKIAPALIHDTDPKIYKFGRWEISKIMSQIQLADLLEPDKVLFINFQEQRDEILQREQEEIEQALEKYGEQERARIRNFYKLALELMKRKPPDRIELGLDPRVDFNEPAVNDRKLALLVKEWMLVIVPIHEEKKLLGGTKIKYDFTKAKPAPVKCWEKLSSFVNSIVSRLPSDVQRIIEANR